MAATPLIDLEFPLRPSSERPAETERRDESATLPALKEKERREDERSLHVRTQFLRRVAHDIASPTGVTMTVLDELASDAKRPELVAMAKRGLKRLLRLSEQLALAADLEAGTITPDTTREDVRNVVKSAHEAALTIDGRRDIKTTCELPETTPLRTNVDRRLVTAVVREVIGNALRLACSRVEIEVEQVGRTAIVRVHDDGPGFSEEVLASLGERFTPRSSVRGLGLSLSMAKEVLAAHGGELHVGASALPPNRRGTRGAAVIISLPLV